MKRLLLVSGFCLTTMLARHAAAEPFDEAKGFMFYEEFAKPLRKTIVPPGEMPLDDYVLALSRASAINFIADATQIPAGARMPGFPATPEAIGRNWKPTFYGVLGDFCRANQLARLRYDEATYLLWNRPDVMAAARLIIAAGQHRPVAALPNQAELYRALDQYARDKIGWNGDAATPPKIRTRLGDLPPALQTSITALARYAILRPDFRRELFLSDDYWETARVRVFPTAQAGVYRVFVGGQDENGKPLPFFSPFLRFLQISDGNLGARVYAPPGAANPAPPAQPQDQPPQAAPPQPATVPPQGLAPAALESLAPLQAKISLEAKHRPLGELLSGIGQQGGVKLLTAEGTPAPGALVTARVNEMPLGTFMGALARVYGAYWTQQSATEYVLHFARLDALQTMLLRSGRGDFIAQDSGWEFSTERMQQLAALEQEIAAALHGQGADKPQGVPVTALPGDLQQSLRTAFEQIAAKEIVQSHQKAWKFLYAESMLNILHTSPRPDSKWSVGLLMADGKYSLMSSTSLDAPPPDHELQPVPAAPNPLPLP